MPKSKRTFVCCYCGEQIIGSEFNVNRHEKIHSKTLKKIKFSFENCCSTFKEKSDYFRHWENKHNEVAIPDGLIYIDRESKPYKLKNKNKCEKSETGSLKSNDYSMLDSSKSEN